MDATLRTSVRARYAVARDSEVAHFLARADDVRITHALFEAVRGLSAPLGLALVEAEDGQEWVVEGLRREVVLESLLSIRDLLGRGGLDVAIFSGHAGFEVFLDRYGTLEFRTGSWGESRVRALLEAQGFVAVDALAAVPVDPAPVPEWDAPTRGRVSGLTSRLGMEEPPPEEDD